MDYFAEKTHQVSVDALTAFGISVTTRYGQAQELAEMLTFARLAAAQGVHGFVKEVFYDSKACLCTIELVDEAMWLAPPGQALRECAKRSIRQFQWDGTIGHGADLLDESDT